MRVLPIVVREHERRVLDRVPLTRPDCPDHAPPARDIAATDDETRRAGDRGGVRVRQAAEHGYASLITSQTSTLMNVAGAAVLADHLTRLIRTLRHDLNRPITAYIPPPHCSMR